MYEATGVSWLRNIHNDLAYQCPAQVSILRLPSTALRVFLYFFSMCLYHICQISSWTKASTETASALVSQISTATYFTRGAKLGSTCTSLAFILTDFQNKSWVVGSCLSQCGFQYFSVQPDSSFLPRNICIFLTLYHKAT